MGLKKEIKVYIESELRSYDTTKKEWEEIQSNIIHKGCSGDDSGIIGTDLGNATQSKALQMISNKRLSQLERTIKAFERVIGRLQEDKFRFVVLKYWTTPQILTDNGIAVELSISKRTLYDWQNGILLALAKEMGLVD